MIHFLDDRQMIIEHNLAEAYWIPHEQLLHLCPVEGVIMLSDSFFLMRALAQDSLRCFSPDSASMQSSQTFMYPIE